MHEPADNLSSFSWQAIKMSSQQLIHPSHKSDSPKNPKVRSGESVLKIVSFLATKRGSTMGTSVKGNVAYCADGVVSYVLLPTGKLARMNYQPGRSSFNTTYLTKAK